MSPQEAIRQLQELNANLAAELDNAEKAALTSGLGLYKGRIFNDGQTTSGQRMGPYTSQYKKKRQKARKQVAYKDLQFEGNLFKGIKVGISGESNVIGFERDIDRLKMQGTEDYLKTDVIPLSEEEKEEIDKVFRARIDKILQG